MNNMDAQQTSDERSAVEIASLKASILYAALGHPAGDVSTAIWELLTEAQESGKTVSAGPLQVECMKVDGKMNKYTIQLNLVEFNDVADITEATVIEPGDLDFEETNEQ